MIEEVAGCGRSLVRGVVYVLSIILGALVILGLVIVALGCVYWYLRFIVQFDSIGVLIGLLAPVVLVISALYFLVELSEIRERRQKEMEQQ